MRTDITLFAGRSKARTGAGMPLKKTFIYIAACLATLIVQGGGMLLSKKSLVLFPSAEAGAFQVTDSADDRGHSVILAFNRAENQARADFQDLGNQAGPGGTEAPLEIVYRLDSGFAWPYAGVGFQWKDSLHCPDLAGFEEMAVTLNSSAAKGYILTLHSVPPDSVRKRTGEGWRLSTQDIPSSPHVESHRLALDGFTIPDWWKTRYGLSPDERNVHLGAVCRFHLISAKHLPVGVPDTLRIARWEMTGTNPWILWAGLLLPLLAWSLFFIPAWKESVTRSWRREADLRHHEPLAVKNEEEILWEKIRNFTAKNYHHGELNAESIAKGTGISSRKVGEIIRNRLEINATQYINTLRVEEASRLLHESDLQVGQIAYQVGFNTVGHFNRVFKDMKGKSPKDLRERKE